MLSWGRSGSWQGKGGGRSRGSRIRLGSQIIPVCSGELQCRVYSRTGNHLGRNHCAAWQRRESSSNGDQIKWQHLRIWKRRWPEQRFNSGILWQGSWDPCHYSCKFCGLGPFSFRNRMLDSNTLAMAAEASAPTWNAVIETEREALAMACTLEVFIVLPWWNQISPCDGSDHILNHLKYWTPRSRVPLPTLKVGC